MGGVALTGSITDRTTVVMVMMMVMGVWGFMLTSLRRSGPVKVQQTTVGVLSGSDGLGPSYLPAQFRPRKCHSLRGEMRAPQISGQATQGKPGPGKVLISLWVIIKQLGAV